MSTQAQKHKAKPEGAPVEEPSRKGGIKRSRPKGTESDLLDEIDGVLETNYQEFVRSYVQKAGE